MTLHLLPTKADIEWQKRHPVGRTPLAIARDVAAAYGLTMKALRSPARSRRVVWARQEAMAEIRECRPDISLPMIGRIFNRDHSTVLHSIRAYLDRQDGGEVAPAPQSTSPVDVSHDMGIVSHGSRQ